MCDGESLGRECDYRVVVGLFSGASGPIRAHFLSKNPAWIDLEKQPRMMTDIPLGKERREGGREKEKGGSCNLLGWGMFNCE